MTDESTGGDVDEQASATPVDDPGGSAVGGQESSGASKGAGGIGLGALDQGATARAVETGGPPGEDETPASEDTSLAPDDADASGDMAAPTISGADRAAPTVEDDT